MPLGLAATLGVLLGGVQLAGWWPGGAAPQGDTLARVLAGAELRIGYAVEAPYAWVDGNGRVTGESPELARLVATTLGPVQIRWVQMPFESLIDGLLAGRIDLIAAGMFITPQRAQRVRFSLPSLRVVPGLLVSATSDRPAAAPYRALAGRAGYRVAVIDGSVEAGELQALGLAPARLLVVPDTAAGTAAVASGLADALALSMPTVRWLAASSGGRLRALPATDPMQPEAGTGLVAYQFRPNDAALLQAWNRGLQRWLGSQAHRRLLARQGLAADDLPGGHGAEQVPAP